MCLFESHGNKVNPAVSFAEKMDTCTDKTLWKTRMWEHLQRKYSTWVFFFFSFFLVWFKKIKNEPIADRHVSVRPAKQCKICRLFRDRKHPSLPFSGSHTTFFPKNPLCIPRVLGVTQLWEKKMLSYFIGIEKWNKITIIG